MLVHTHKSTANRAKETPSCNAVEIKIHNVPIHVCTQNGSILNIHTYWELEETIFLLLILVMHLQTHAA